MLTKNTYLRISQVESVGYCQYCFRRKGDHIRQLTRHPSSTGELYAFVTNRDAHTESMHPWVRLSQEPIQRIYHSVLHILTKICPKPI